MLSGYSNNFRAFTMKFKGCACLRLLTILTFIGVIPFPCNGSELIIGVGRSFYDGPESATFLHGSTRSWEALVDLDDQLRPIPWLATEWSSSQDRKIWTFTLRKNVIFHNGDKLKAWHVVESIKRLKLHPKYDPFNRYEIVESIEAPDDYHVVFRLSRPCLFFPNLVAYYGSPIFHPLSWDERGRIKQFIATGPYKPQSITPDSRIVLVRHENYWGKKPPYDRVIFRILQDAHVRALSLISGSIDAIVDVGGILPDHYSFIAGYYPDIAIMSKEVATTHYIIFNSARHPLSDKKLRLWLASSLDRKELVDKLMKGFGIVAMDPYSRLNKTWSFSLLESFKLTDNIKFNIAIEEPVIILLHSNTISRWSYKEIAQIIEKILGSVKIPSQILIREKALYLDMLKKGQFHITIQPFTMMTGDPDCVYSFLLPQTKWHHSEAERLIETAKETTDEGSRVKMYYKLETILASEVPLLPIFHDVALYAYRTNKGRIYMDSLFRPVFE